LKPLSRNVRVEDQPPLGPIVFQILVALGDGERHGYDINKEVSEATHGYVRLGAGSFYRHLSQLCQDGWIVQTQRTDDDAMGRRYYRLTPRGRRIAQAEARRLEQVLRTARARRIYAT
jgi:DNA-binding PadR family transcriptional regulator